MKLPPHPFWIAIAASCCLATASVAGAQPKITTDGTLSTLVTSPDNLNFRISEGNRAGGNLFHSFGAFSVPNGGSAFFNNPPDIVNIIGRVTGGTVSNIDGLLRANGTANLYLMNPNGIIFGAGARLDIGGSFLATTASAVKFADGREFSATATGAEPLLTVNVPIGLQYNGTSAGITVQGANLEVRPGNTLALVGGNLDLFRGTAQAPDGRVELMAVQGTGTIGLQLLNNQLQLSFSPQVQLANISLTDGTLVSTSGSGGGDIQISGRQIQLVDSRVEANTIDSTALGELNIFASESVAITGNNAGGKFDNGLFAENTGSGAGANLTITTGDLQVQGEARISTATFGTGKGGNLTVNATNSVNLIGIDPPADDTLGELFTGLLTDTHGAGSGGNLTINAQQLRVQNGAQVTAVTYGSGNGGNLIVKASEEVQLLGATPSDLLSSGLFTAAQPDTTGNAGNISVDAKRLVVRDGAQIFTGTGGAGDGGNLTVNATDSIELIGVSPIFLFSSGLFSNSDATFSAEASSGSAGNLTVNTARLIVRDGALVTVQSIGTGRAGTLTVNATDKVQLSGVSPLIPDFGYSPSGVFASVLEIEGRPFNNRNPAGDIKVNTGRLIIEGGAKVGVTNFGQGNGGNIDIQASNLVIDNAGNPELDNPGGIEARTVSREGGNINLQVPNSLLLRHGGAIATDATAGEGNGGNITINTDILTSLENSDITAKAVAGRGGNIDITTQGIFLSPDSEINASSQLGINGQVNINTPAIDPSKGVIILPTQVVSVEGLVATGCGAPNRQNISRFVATGRGGLPPNPSEGFDSETILPDWGTPAKLAASPPRNVPAGSVNVENSNLVGAGLANRPSISQITFAQNPPLQVEARGWFVNASGQVVLTANPAQVTTQRPWISAVSCQGR